MAHNPPPTWLVSRTHLGDADARHLERARALVAAMSLEEKLPFLHQHSPGLERLGIGPFSTGTEALHGVAWRGPAVTYPPPVGLAASWDRSLLEAVGEQIAREVRVHHGHENPASLNVWAPVVNPLRHPLWGRTEEGLSEDPLLNAQLGTAVARGLRGEGDTWTTIPTLKHFLAYSNETDRAATSSSMPPRVLHEYELPGFEEPLVGGAAGAVMLAYNLVDGVPAHLSPLVDSHLRALVADPDLLFVVSDAGAPTNLITIQDVAADLTEAVAAMLRAGVDSFTDHGEDSGPTVRAARNALERELIEERHIDQAVVRQLVARARTGEFEEITPSLPRFDQGQAIALSEEAARRSAVLLRHDRETLPAQPGERIAVLGHLAGTVLRDWYSGELIEPVPLVDALVSSHAGPVVHAPCLDEITLHDGAFTLGRRHDDVLCVGPLPSGSEPTEPLSFDVIDHGLDVISLRDRSTGRLLAPDDAGYLRAESERVGGWIVQETFRRVVGADGTVRLKHVGTGRWVRREHHSGKVQLGAYEPRHATAWTWQVTSSRRDQARDAITGADLVIVVAGHDPHVHGRETEDRTTLSLMPPDLELVELLEDLPAGARSTLLMLSSYPYDLAGHAETADAVVWSSHAGARMGPAITSLLLGHKEFSGRLAQAWVTEDSLADILDYDVISSASTYLYGQPAGFPFGHGLALEPTRWEEPEFRRSSAGVSVSVALERDAHLPAHEVVQVYAAAKEEQYPEGVGPVPMRRLVGVEVVEVPARGARHVEIKVPSSRCALWNEQTGSFVEPVGPVKFHLARSVEEIVATEVL